MIATSIWRSRKFRALENDAARMTYLYLHTSKHGNSAGAFIMPPELAALELPFNSAQAGDALANLSDVGLIRRDEDEEMVQIVDFFRVNVISSIKHAAGPVSVLEALPHSHLVQYVAADITLAMVARLVEWREKIQSLRAAENPTRNQSETLSRMAQSFASFAAAAADVATRHKAAEIIPKITTEPALLNGVSEHLSIPLSVPLAIQGDGDKHGYEDEDGHEDEDEDEDGKGEKSQKAAKPPDLPAISGQAARRGKRVPAETAAQIAELRAKAGK